MNGCCKKEEAANDDEEIPLDLLIDSDKEEVSFEEQ